MDAMRVLRSRGDRLSAIILRDQHCPDPGTHPPSREDNDRQNAFDLGDYV